MTDFGHQHPPKGRGSNPTFPVLLIVIALFITLKWIPALEASAQAYRAHTEEMIKHRRCEDTSKPVTRRAVVSRETK